MCRVGRLAGLVVVGGSGAPIVCSALGAAGDRNRREAWRASGAAKTSPSATYLQTGLRIRRQACRRLSCRFVCPAPVPACPDALALKAATHHSSSNHHHHAGRRLFALPSACYRLATLLGHLAYCEGRAVDGAGEGHKRVTHDHRPQALKVPSQVCCPPAAKLCC